VPGAAILAGAAMLAAGDMLVRGAMPADAAGAADVRGGDMYGDTGGGAGGGIDTGGERTPGTRGAAGSPRTLSVNGALAGGLLAAERAMLVRSQSSGMKLPPALAGGAACGAPTGSGGR